MNKPNLNPFHYGNPVPTKRFIGREDAQRTIFGRLSNGESTAVVGEPHIGKSSFLRYVRDDHVRNAWLRDADAYAFVDLDCHLIPQSYQPSDFWREVLDRIAEIFPAEQIRQQIEVVRQSGYGSFTLKRLFDLLGRDDKRAVLLVDEFDVLLHHPSFNTAEFFGALRSLAVQTNGLALITSSRLPVAEMNRRSHEINPLGSPFFNNLIEVRLLPLQPVEMDLLIDQALDGSGVNFTRSERAYIAQASGRHPFLAQITCAALFEATTQTQNAAKRRAEIERMVQDWAADHFGDVWRHLTAEARRIMLLLTHAELQASFSTSQLGQLDQYDTTLRWLAAGRMIEATNDKHCASWAGERRRVSARSFAQWMIDNHKWDDVEGRAMVAQPGEDEHAERIKFLRKKIAAERKRLDQLELQKARTGIQTDAAVVNEIESLTGAIADDERELRHLDGNE